MDVDWQKFGIKAYNGIKDVGAVAVISCITRGEYDVTTGIESESIVTYDSHAIIKQYVSDSGQVIDDENVEITFHSGSTPDTIPDLTDIGKIEISTQGKIFTVNSIQAIRPAGVTMLYKAKASENRDA